MEIIFEGVVFLYPQIFADQLIYQLGGADYAHHITIGTPGFSELPTALKWVKSKGNSFCIILTYVTLCVSIF